MEIRFLICSVFSISFLSMKAQEKFSAEVNAKTEPTEKINFNETNVGFSFRKNMSSKSAIANTIEYSNVKLNYDAGDFKSFEDINQLNQIKDKLDFSVAVAERTKLKFSAEPTVNFQHNLNATDFNLLGSFNIIQELASKAIISIGAARTTAFGYPQFIPILSLEYKLNEQSNILIGFPDSKISYSNNNNNNNNRNTFSLTNSFNGNFYHLDNQNGTYNSSNVVLSQMTSAFSYERNVDKNWFIDFKAGYDFNKKYNITDDNNHKVYDFNISDGYILGIGIKYKQ